LFAPTTSAVVKIFVRSLRLSREKPAIFGNVENLGEWNFMDP
jgi:hypothetical protein